MGILTDLRDHIYNQIVHDQEADPSPYGALAGFNIVKEWIPMESMESMTRNHPNGKMYLIGADFDDQVITRSNAADAEITIMMGYQRAGVSPSDNALIESLVNLKEALRESVRFVDPPGYGYLRSEPLRDSDSGIPFSLMTLRNGNMFEAIWTSHFATVLQPPNRTAP